MQSEVEKRESSGVEDSPGPDEGAQSASIRICEIYESLQGEGLLVGTPSIFVRTSGCNLRCWFCDTPFASWNPEGDSLTLDEIEGRCGSFSAQHYVITGGEPMIFAGIASLTTRLHEAGKHITIETAGTVYQPVQCDLMSISPKLQNSTPSREQASESLRQSHERRRENFEVMKSLLDEFPYQLKFVVDKPSDGDEVLQYLDRLQAYCGKSLDRERMLIMPQGTTPEELNARAEWLIPWCKDQDLRFCPRDHIAWFGNKRQT